MSQVATMLSNEYPLHSLANTSLYVKNIMYVQLESAFRRTLRLLNGPRDADNNLIGSDGIINWSISFYTRTDAFHQI